MTPSRKSVPTPEQREQDLREIRQRRRYGDPMSPERVQLVNGLTRLAIELHKDALKELERHEASLPLSGR